MTWFQTLQGTTIEDLNFFEGETVVPTVISFHHFFFISILKYKPKRSRGTIYDLRFIQFERS